MLKVKDSVDLKELEKYSLIKCNISNDDEDINDVYAFIDDLWKDDDLANRAWIDNYLIEFYIDKNGYIKHCKYSEQISWGVVKDKLYDRIKDGLVEKV